MRLDLFHSLALECLRTETLDGELDRDRNQRHPDRKCERLEGRDHLARNWLERRTKNQHIRWLVRVVTLLDIKPRGAHEDTLLVTERVERLLAVVRAHTRLTDTAKWKARVGELHNGVVDADTARRRLTKDLLAVRAAARVAVQGQRLLVLVDEVNALVQRLVVVNRQEWTKDLLTHARRIAEGLEVTLEVEKGWLDVTILGVHGATKRDVRLVLDENTSDALELTRVDESAQVFALLRVLPKELSQGLLKQSNELVTDLGAHKHVVWTHTRLTGVHQRGPSETLHGHGEIAGFVNDRWTLATELEDRRRQVLGRRRRDDLADERAAGAEDEVETLIQHDLGRFHVAMDVTHKALVDVFVEQLDNGVVGVHTRVITWQTQQDGVTGTNGTHKRLERQLHRVVPRRNDADDTQRVTLDARAARQVDDVGGHLLWLGPVVHVVQVLLDFVVNHSDFHQSAFDLALVQVLAQRRGQLLASDLEHLAQLQEHLTTRLEVARDAALEGSTELAHVALNALGRRVWVEVSRHRHARWFCWLALLVALVRR